MPSGEFDFASQTQCDAAISKDGFATKPSHLAESDDPRIMLALAPDQRSCGGYRNRRSGSPSKKPESRRALFTSRRFRRPRESCSYPIICAMCQD